MKKNAVYERFNFDLDQLFFSVLKCIVFFGATTKNSQPIPKPWDFSVCLGSMIYFE